MVVSDRGQLSIRERDLRIWMYLPSLKIIEGRAHCLVAVERTDLLYLLQSGLLSLPLMLLVSCQ